MTDHLDNASQAFLDAHSKSLSQADSKILEGCVSLLQHLHSTPTAPARTEERSPLLDVIRQFQAEAPNAFSELESPDADGGDGPSDTAPPEFTAAVGVVQVAWARKVSGPEHFAMVAAFEAGRSSAARKFIDPREVTSVIDGYFPGRVRHSCVAANVLWHLHEVLAEKDRDLAEAKSQLLAQGRIASDLYRSSQAQSGATATLAAEKDRELAEFREAHIDCSEVKLALSAIIDEKDRELAELREKVKAWTPVMREANRLRDAPRFATSFPVLADAYDAIPAHLRPGSGSDEGKA